MTPASRRIGGPSVVPPEPPVAPVLPPLPPPSCDPSPPFTLQAAIATQNSAAPHPLGPNSPIRTEPPGPQRGKHPRRDRPDRAGHATGAGSSRRRDPSHARERQTGARHRNPAPAGRRFRWEGRDEDRPL